MGDSGNQLWPECQPPAKRQKSSHPSDATKITDLSYDCLEKIFNRLNFMDFFNIALSNKTLQKATASAFKQKFGIEVIILDPAKNINDGKFHEGKIRMVGLKSCLQFLRCFGEIITDLEIWHNRTNRPITEYIQQYCADSLIKILFRHCSISRTSFQKPFPNVEVVSIDNVDLGDSLSHFVDWFPNMVHLICETGEDFRHKNWNPVAMPQLQRMTISSKHQDLYAELLRANPQLRIIELDKQRMAMKRSLDLIESNDFIEILRMSHNCTPFVSVNPKDVKRLVRNHPFLVEVDLPIHRFNAKSAMILIRHLNALKMFQFAMDQAEYYDIQKRLDREWQHTSSNRSNQLVIKLTR